MFHCGMNGAAFNCKRKPRSLSKLFPPPWLWKTVRVRDFSMFLFSVLRNAKKRSETTAYETKKRHLPPIPASLHFVSSWSDFSPVSQSHNSEYLYCILGSTAINPESKGGWTCWSKNQDGQILSCSPSLCKHNKSMVSSARRRCLINRLDQPKSL